MPNSGKNTISASVAPARPVPMLDLARQYESIREEINATVQRVCASQQYIMGKEVAEFENESAAFLGVKHAAGCASGTDAIWLSLLAANVGPGDEVITTPFSFFATASTIMRAGARPVFVDVEAETLNIDITKIKRRLTHSGSAKVKAILPVHLYGQCAEMDGLMQLAADRKITIIEDAAQAFGSSWKKKRAGSIGHIAAFSFYPTKNLSCYGDGGLVTTNDEALADRVRLLRNHGSRRRYYHEELGWNSRLDALQAAILRVKLQYIEQWNAKRRERASAYELLLRSSGLLAAPGAGVNPPVRLLSTRKEATHIYHQFVVRVERRDALREFLAKQGIGSEVYYPVPLHLQKCFGYLGYAAGTLPESERAAEDVIALPIFPEITAAEQTAVVNAMAEFYS